DQAGCNQHDCSNGQQHALNNLLAWQLTLLQTLVYTTQRICTLPSEQADTNRCRADHNQQRAKSADHICQCKQQVQFGNRKDQKQKQTHKNSWVEGPVSYLGANAMQINDDCKNLSSDSGSPDHADGRPQQKPAQWPAGQEQPNT